MEYCGGKSLRDLIKEDSWEEPKDQTKRILIFQILSALKFIHSKGLIHRDLKPSNILLSEDQKIQIVDFGLATYFIKKKNLNNES